MEEWREIAGTNGWYEVSSEGRVRSWRMSGRHGIGRRRAEARLLKAYADEAGYCRVSIYPVPSLLEVRTVHSLVAEAFIGPRPEGQVICHGDGDPGNNFVENLRYDTPQGNSNDRIKHNRAPRGVRNGSAVLTEEKVEAIRALHEAGRHSNRQLARIFGVSKSTVNQIVLGRSWRAA